MRKGTKVKFIGCSKAQMAWGSCDDPNSLLFKGDTYYIEKVDVHSWHTRVELRGVVGKFNSVCFEEVE